MAPITQRPGDLVLVAILAVFCTTSFVFEPYVLFGVDLAATTDPVGRAWFWYASSFDPVFLDTPLWLRVMCGIDAVVFGPCYVALIYGLVRGRPWTRLLAMLYGSAIVYSTVVYFGWEFLDADNRAHANLPMVVLINVPYTLVPLALMWRLRRPVPPT